MPGGWGDVLAAVGGGLHGIDVVQERDAADKLEHEKMAQAERIANMHDEVRQMLEKLKQDELDKRYDRPSANAQLGADTQRRGQDVTFDLGTRRDATTRRGQDVSSTTTQRGQDMSAATARRGQDVSSSTSRRGQDLNDAHYWDSSARMFEGMRLGDQRARKRDAVDAYGHDVTAGRANQGLSLDPTPLPQFKDWLKGNQNLFDAPAETPPAAAPAVAPPAARPQTPAPAPAPQQGASRYQKGQTVKLKNGQKVTIKQINPDGTFVY